MDTCDATGSEVADYVRLPAVIQLLDCAAHFFGAFSLCLAACLSLSLSNTHIHSTSYLSFQNFLFSF